MSDAAQPRPEASASDTVPLAIASSPLLAFGRLTVIFANMFAVFLVQYPAIWLRLRIADVIPHKWHGMCRRIMGVEVEVHGAPVVRGPVLFVSNHVSYLDIVTLGSLMVASFVAKAEIAKWPLFGSLCRLQRTVFVDRRPRYAAKQRHQIADRLKAGDSLILFPEGTSGDGIHVLPFKSTLFSAADTEVDGHPVTVQPISLTYTRLDGLPLGRLLRPLYSWYGDMEMVSHMWRLLGVGTVKADVIFHPPVTLAGFESRKALAEHCQQVIAAGVSRSLAGRHVEPVDAATADDLAEPAVE